MRSQMETERAQYTAALDAIEQRANAIQTPPQQEIAAQGFDPMQAAYERAYAEGDTAQMMKISADYAAKNTLDAVGKLLDDKLGEFRPAIESTQAAQRESQIRMAEDIVSRQLGHDNWRELLPQVSTLIQDHPHYLPQAASVEGYAAAILDVAKLAQHDSLSKTVEQLQAERLEKLQAQTVPGAGVRSAFTPDQQKDEWSKIVNAPNDSYQALRSRQ